MVRRRKPQRFPLRPRQSSWNRRDALSPRERVQLLRLLCSGGIFVLLVAAKLLLPGKMTGMAEKLSQTLRRSVDVTAVFSAVGDLLRPEHSGTLGELYQAVFQPEAALPSQTAAADFSGKSQALSQLRRWSRSEAAADVPLQLPAGEAGAAEASLSYLVLYSDEDLPEHVSMHQAILGFDYKTPVAGTLSSGFGYRDHPTEGAERFHYGLDLAADTGTPIACFADGTVSAVGQSSSYGKYCTVTHKNGCTTLYAHCSRISVSPGDAVKAGQNIGEVGQSGLATGPHLHFEVQKDGVYLNPIYYVETA